MKRQLINIALALLAITPKTIAQDNFNDIISEIISNNPTLSAESARLQSELASSKADNVLADPEVDFDYKWGHNGAPDKWGIAVRQSFDWPGMYHAKNKATKHQENAFVQLYKSKVLENALDVKLLLLDIITTKQQISLLDQVIDNIDSLTVAYEKAFEKGEATILDIRKLRIQNSSMRNRRTDIEAQVDLLRTSLTAINGGKYIDISSLSDYPVETLRSEDEYLDIYTNSDPALAGQAELLNAAKQRAKAARQQRFPGFSVGYIHEKEGDSSFNGLSIGITLPVWSKKQQIKAAKQEIESINFGNIDYNLQRRASIIADRMTAEKLQNQANSMKKSFGFGPTSYETLLLKALNGGQITLFEYFNELNWFIEAQMEYLDITYRYAQIVAKLNKYDLAQ